MMDGADAIDDDLGSPVTSAVLTGPFLFLSSDI